LWQFYETCRLWAYFGLTYRHIKLDKECWFGEQYSNLPTEFARNAKRSASKKQTGRPKNSEKALSKFLFKQVIGITQDQSNW